ncbi:MAG: hypothetical protein ACPH3C_07165, partial [Glaciecola sp.]
MKRLFIATSAAVFIAGCGGGGGNSPDTNPVNPSTPTSPTSNNITVIEQSNGFDFYGDEGDILIIISSSGQSKNILNGVKAAKK